MLKYAIPVRYACISWIAIKTISIIPSPMSVHTSLIVSIEIKVEKAWSARAAERQGLSSPACFSRAAPQTEAQDETATRTHPLSVTPRSRSYVRDRSSCRAIRVSEGR